MKLDEKTYLKLTASALKNWQSKILPLHFGCFAQKRFLKHPFDSA